jgi:hypothetical protein
VTEEPLSSNQAQSRAEAAAAGGTMKRSEDSTRLGTAHGRSESSRVEMTSFERAQASPDEVITIRYDRRENLIAMGVIAAPVATPNPFPSSVLGFVPDPPAR